MKQDRLNLENAITIILAEYNLDEEIFKTIYKTLKDKNVTKGQTRGIYNQLIALESLDLPLLYWFTKALHRETKEDMINPDRFFTELEEEEFSKMKINKGIDIKIKGDSIIMDNVLRVVDDQWTTALTYKQISDLYSLGLIRYNPQTQRNLKSKYVNGNMIEKININTNAVQQIKNLILKGLFIPNAITLNILKTGEEEIRYNETEKIIDIQGEVDIVDGFHRSLAIIEAIRDNPELKGKMIVTLGNFDIEKAQLYIVQEDKKNPISKDHIRSLSQENLENQIAKNLNESTKCELRGLITTDINLIKNNKALVLFNTLAEAIKMSFKLENQRDVRKVSDYLNEFFNELTGIMHEDFKDINKSRRDFITTYSTTFIGYITIAKELYYTDYENWQNKLEKILEKIDFINDNDIWEELNIFNNRPIKKDFKKIIKYFENIL